MNIDSLLPLKWPDNRFKLALLGPYRLQLWYAIQDPRAMIFIGQTQDFRRFWLIFYIIPIKFMRFGLKIKRFFTTYLIPIKSQQKG